MAHRFVLAGIDDILSWEKTQEKEKDVRFVELGENLCGVRAKPCWRLDNLKSLDESLEKRFADSHRKAYYLMAIHEKLTRIPRECEKTLHKLNHWDQVAERQRRRLVRPSAHTFYRLVQNILGSLTRLASVSALLTPTVATPPS